MLEIAELLEEADIRALVLKGLGLAYQIYPTPALRPISDLDLFLKKDELCPPYIYWRTLVFEWIRLASPLDSFLGSNNEIRRCVTVSARMWNCIIWASEIRQILRNIPL